MSGFDGGLRRAFALPLVLAGLVLGAPPPAAADGGESIQLVFPGESIQAALDDAAEGGSVYVYPGTYRETASGTNGLNITRGVKLIGLSTPGRRVVLENSGGQSNGIVAVPPAHTECMSCHSSMEPPFPLRDGVDATVSSEPVIQGLTVRGITIKDFANNGLFTRNVDGFVFADVHSVGNKNYGIFPTLSRNGLITLSSATGADDSGIWVETSENVKVTYSEVSGNVNGFEVSNSDDIELAHNKVHGNTVGMAILFLPDIFDERDDTQRITVRENHIYDNNKENTARPNSILATVPSGIGILHLGADDSLIARNLVEHNDFIGIGVVDYCAVVAGGPFDCTVDPDVVGNPGFLIDNIAVNNQVRGNVVVGNGDDPGPANPFGFAAADLSLLTLGDWGNCFSDNVFRTSFSTLGALPPCP
jgi:parallel beta-helix repeat protein